MGHDSSRDSQRTDETIPGFGALLDALGVSIVAGRVTAPPELGRKAGRIEVAAIGCATVELDRAAASLGAELDTTFEPTHRDGLLGASVRRSTKQDPSILLLEPDTEGRLSGALAKHGEGPVALYLRVASLDALPVTLSTRNGVGPLGAARLVFKGPQWGPFLILVAGPSKIDPDRVPSEP
ncbi:MAG: hypothetical protein ACRDGI_07080 [Candidatus Limnocylindrales bacterium]